MAAGLFLFLLLLVFIGMGATVLAVVQGTPDKEVSDRPYHEGWLTGLPPLLLMVLVVVLGVWTPPPLRQLLVDAVNYLEVTP